MTTVAVILGHYPVAVVLLTMCRRNVFLAAINTHETGVHTPSHVHLPISCTSEQCAIKATTAAAFSQSVSRLKSPSVLSKALTKWY